jgi:hypothetical protein
VIGNRFRAPETSSIALSSIALSSIALAGTL